MTARQATMGLVMLIVAVSDAAVSGANDGQSRDMGDQASKTQRESDISTLIERLDANRFSKRQDASRLLKAKGTEAIAALQEAAKNGNRETSSRAFRILKEHFSSEKEKLKRTSQGALEELAKSEDASVARTADSILNPQPKRPEQETKVLAQRRIRLQFRLGGGARQVQMKNVNGVKKIEVQEKNRSVKIKEDPQNGIQVEITEQKDGKKINKKIQAKDAAELKKKNPEAHKLYQKYSKQGGAAQIQANVQAIQIPGQIQKARGKAGDGGDRHEDAQSMAKGLEKLSKRVQRAKTLLQRFKANPRQKALVPQAIEQLEEIQKQLKETRRHAK